MWRWTVAALPVAGLACPKGFREFKEGCYAITEEMGSMTQCQDNICTSLGATLAVIHDVEVQFFLANLTHEKKAPAFVGLYERGSNESGDWTWLDGSNMSFEPEGVNQTVNPLAGWAYTEPDNWCLDEDCAALGMDYISNYSSAKFGVFAPMFNMRRTMGFFDIACSTQLHCLCQTGDVLPAVTQDFLMWEFNNSLRWDENSLHMNRTYWENYMTCFKKRTRCWWYNDTTFQLTFVLLSLLCLGCLVFSLAGCNGGAQREVTLNDATAASNYGQLLEACERQSEVDNTVDRWIVIGAWASMAYGVTLVLLSVTTMCHVNFGIGFGFGVDGLEAVLLSALQVLICGSACMVQKHLSTASRHVVQWWVLAFALAKLGMAVGDFILAIMYFNETLGGFVKQNSSFCTAGYLFLWMLMTSMICQSVAGTAFARIHVGAVQQMGGAAQVTKIIGCSGLLLIFTTFGAGMGLGLCGALFIFDNSNDTIDPMAGISITYFGAALCQFLAGAALLRANTQVRAYFQRDARSITEMQSF